MKFFGLGKEKSKDPIKMPPLGTSASASVSSGPVTNSSSPFNSTSQVKTKMETSQSTSSSGTKPNVTQPNLKGHGVASISGVTHIVAVSSGKGGVGKSTVSVNLAVSLALEGYRVGLMDADVYGPNIPTMMGVTEQPKIFQHPERGELFSPPISHGVKVMSMGMLIDPDQPLVWRGPMLHSVINQFCHQVDWGTLDYLIVDMPPGTGDVQLSLAQMVSVTGAILVTTPQEVSLQDVRKAYHMFDKVRVPILGIVENMSYFQPEDSDKRYFIFGENGGKLLAEKFKSELLAQFPLVATVREGGDAGRPIAVKDQKSDVALGFRALARRLNQKVEQLVAEGIDPKQIVQIGKF
jgi:ATP-binding protein involved in chromosome partitioning